MAHVPGQTISLGRECNPAAPDERAVEQSIPMVGCDSGTGMLTTGTIDGLSVEMLVDTGAAVSLVSADLARKLGYDPDRLTADAPGLKFCGADGKPLVVNGKVVVHLGVQGCVCSPEMRVVDGLRFPCVLGRDVLSSIPCNITSANGKLCFKVEERRGSGADEAPLRLQEKIVLPPHHEMTVAAVVDTLAFDGMPELGLTEPDCGTASDPGLLVAKCVVRPQENRVPVRLMNCTAEQITLPKRAQIGKLCAVATVVDGSEELDEANDWCSYGANQDLWSVLRVGNPDGGPGAGKRSPGGKRLLETGGGDDDGRSHHCAMRDDEAVHEADVDQRGRGTMPDGCCSQEGNREACSPPDTGNSEQPVVEAEQLARLRTLVEQYRCVFAMNMSELGRTDVLKHEIRTSCDGPVYEPARRLPWSSRETCRKLVDDMLEQGVIEESVSPWSSPVVLVRKKDGSTRFCVDYRRVNAITVKDPYPLPRIDDTLDALGGAMYFSTLDLCSGYHQMPMDEADKAKTAFSTPDGHYEFNVMPFGVCNGPSSFQRLMSAVLRGLQWQMCLVYLDDIIVFSKTFDEHLERLEAVFQRLLEAGLRLKPSKCHLLRTEVNFLGHVVTKDGVRTDPDKIETVSEWRCPKNVAEVRSFMGFCGYYRRFVKDFASISRPLVKLTRQNQRFSWDGECEIAFQLLKQKMSSAPTLAYPRFETDAPPFVVDVDASGHGLGAVLSQTDADGRERPIAYASRGLNSAERNYGSTKSELLGLVWAFRHFRCYLLGRRFVVRTDHQALKYLNRFKEPSAIVARWLEFLSDFDYEVRYRKGKVHANADGLSRQVQDQRCGTTVPDEVIAVVSDERSSVENAESVQSDLPTPFVRRRNWTSADWADVQQRDHELTRLSEWLSSGSSSPDLTGVSPALRHYFRGRKCLVVREDVICRVLHSENAGEGTKFQILVPVALRGQVLSEYHDHLGHLGVTRTYHQIQSKLFWYGMKRDVEDWIGSCASCSRRSRPVGRGSGAPLEVTWSGYPFERVGMDLIPGLPETDAGNKHILVIVDYFTKWVEAYPLKRMDASTIASKFVSEFVARFGAPESVHTDQGKNFDSRLFRDVCS
eukprot:scpid20142/ scgid26552/ Retrovirus-related Pol polyprotein from transposon 17.6; Protease; Reverse transcriptase; Endonuclease